MWLGDEASHTGVRKDIWENQNVGIFSDMFVNAGKYWSVSTREEFGW